LKSAFNPQSILIYTGGEILGDGLLKLPFIYGLKKAYPKATVTWLAGRGRTVYTSILKPLVEDYIDEIREDAGIGLSPLEIFKKNPLPHHHYDLIIDTQKRAFIPPILKKISHKRMIAPAASFFFSHARPEEGVNLPRHLSHYLSTLASLAGKKVVPLIQPPSLPLEYISLAMKLLPEGEVYVGLAPGAGNLARGKSKCWPRDKFVALAQDQLSQGRTPVIILGPAEKEWYPELSAQLPKGLFPLQEKENCPTSPLFTIALAQRLGLGVANDSGVGHMFALAGVPVLSLFGPTDPEKVSPIATKSVIVRAQDFGGEALDRIPLKAVIDKVDEML